jgi:uncharacterized protein YacL
VGRAVSPTPTSSFIGVLLGALVGYVLGGLGGRATLRAIRSLVRRIAGASPAEVLAASLVGVLGLLVALAIGIPILVVFHTGMAAIGVALLTWVLAGAGLQVGIVKGRQIAAATGLVTHFAPAKERVAPGSVIVDLSGLMEPSFASVARTGVLTGETGELVVPRFVLDELHTLVDSPDPVASRRARRALEALDDLRHDGFSIQTAMEEFAGLDDLGDKVVALCESSGLGLVTAAKELAARVRELGLMAVDLEELASSFKPEVVPGAMISLELVAPGKMDDQAVGYLPSGDLVVVNNAAEFVGSTLEVVVTSSRPTSQGTLFFARPVGQSVSR